MLTPTRLVFWCLGGMMTWYFILLLSHIIIIFINKLIVWSVIYVCTLRQIPALMAGYPWKFWCFLTRFNWCLPSSNSYILILFYANTYLNTLTFFYLLYQKIPQFSNKKRKQKKKNRSENSAWKRCYEIWLLYLLTLYVSDLFVVLHLHKILGKMQKK